mgnify:CR=1 FL=1
MINNDQNKQSPPYSEADKAQAGLIAFFSICKEWELNSEEQQILLGDPARGTLFNWKRDVKKVGKLPRDTLDRISYILGIYKSLHILFSESNIINWLRNPNKNPLFNKLSPLEYMKQGQLVALSDVRRYLDWARG